MNTKYPKGDQASGDFGTSEDIFFQLLNNSLSDFSRQILE